jgi:hypothetical protein
MKIIRIDWLRIESCNHIVGTSSNVAGDKRNVVGTESISNIRIDKIKVMIYHNPLFKQ